MRKGLISASMMCAGIDKIFYYLTEFKESDLEFLHVDIMDGQFVPNFALGTDYVRSLRRVSNIPLDYHFLVMNPLEKMSWFDIREGDHAAFHIEKNDNVAECLQFLKRKGAMSFIAINPETDFHVLEPYLNDIDGVLVMCVHPGFPGKKLVRSTINKVSELKKYLLENDRSDVLIEVDGNITIENAKIFYDRGADIFVAGTSSLFKKGEKSTEEIIREERRVIGWDI